MKCPHQHVTSAVRCSGAHPNTVFSLGRCGRHLWPVEAAGLWELCCRPRGNRVVPTFTQAPLGAPPSLTFAVFAVPRVAGLADALVRPRGVLADGIDVAMVRAFHTLIYICQGRAGHVRTELVSLEWVLKVCSPEAESPYARAPSSEHFRNSNKPLLPQKYSNYGDSSTTL